MRWFLDTIQFDDYCSSLILLAILFCFGDWVVRSRPPVRTWGLRLGYLAFVASFCIRVATERRLEAQALLEIAFSSLLVAAFAVAVGWVVLPAFSALYALTVGQLVGAFRARLPIWRDGRRKRAEQVRLELERKLAADEWERSAADRERQQLVAEQRVLEQAATQKRRDDARTRCRMLYDTWAPEIGERFTREQFQAYVTDYLNDRQTPEYVEERALQLNELIRQHVEKVDPAPQIKSLDQLRRWFEDRRKEIESEPDDKLQRNLMARLKKRYDDLAAQLLEELPP